MAKSTEEPTAFETLSRLVIMLGSVTVAGMGFYVYGPPHEEAAAAIDHVVGRVRQMLADSAGDRPRGVAPSGATPQPGAPPAVAPSTMTPPTMTPPLSPPPAFASQPSAAGVAPVLTPPPPTNPQNSSEAQLTRLGAERVRVEPWGSGGGLYRCSFSAPIAGPSGFQKHFEAVGASPGAATAAGHAALLAWRNSGSTIAVR